MDDGDDQGELIAGQGGYDVRVAFAERGVALELVPQLDFGAPVRTELNPESAVRLAVELELAAAALTREGRRSRRRRFF